jgi:hypothetical protein
MRVDRLHRFMDSMVKLIRKGALVLNTTFNNNSVSMYIDHISIDKGFIGKISMGFPKLSNEV